jgi:hypothetical protein
MNPRELTQGEKTSDREQTIIRSPEELRIIFEILAERKLPEVIDCLE